jgi:hypothetical protein
VFGAVLVGVGGYRTATLQQIINLEAGEHPSVLAVCHSFMSGLATRRAGELVYSEAALSDAPVRACLLMVSGDMA